ncbi:MAG: uncharacterized protein KVP18_002182 [Porospora cf. gigantea A]|uniref:uncharacterized protein n=2 Tax=Porospora cf. gigantea A TaxID=2853593 RepID=UPI00355A6DB7|nr:MAG: hypothetical protein KVP18_002182 [Porospora cf. gigantea A]
MSESAKIPQGQYEDIIDGSIAAATIAYRCTDGAFIYPITPSSAASEYYESLSAANEPNVFGNVPSVRQLQSEGGAAGAVHGGLSVGSVVTTFTASQGLLLMIPPMYKISGELLPCVFHVSARAVAGQALSIFGDHSDVMAARATGFAMLTGCTVQEVVDLSLIAHCATLKASIPFLHFYDGFRISHEIQKVLMFDSEFIRSFLPMDAVHDFRQRGLNPCHPYLKGASQGPEVYFQNLETANPYYFAAAQIVQDVMDDFAAKAGRRYQTFDFFGDPAAESVVVTMGNGGPVIREYLEADPTYGAKRGVIFVRLFRPWDMERFMAALPKTARRVAVLDKTKESGSLGEPLFLDVCATVQQLSPLPIKVIGGRYGLGSREFTPTMAAAVYGNLERHDSLSRFTVGINDDVTNLSIPLGPTLMCVPAGTRQCMFWGMGSDGTVSANKNVIKIIGKSTSMEVQGFFHYSADKAGGLTVSHLRFGPKPIYSQYLLEAADFVAVHRDQYIYNFDVTKNLNENSTFVLNCVWSPEELEEKLPTHVKRQIAAKNASVYIINAYRVAKETNMGRRVNNILMTCFWKLSHVIPFDRALALFKGAIQSSYGKKGQHVVEANYKAVDAALENLIHIEYDKTAWLNADGASTTDTDETVHATGTSGHFAETVLKKVNRMDADIPVSSFTHYEGGRLPLGTTTYEKKGIALEVPIVDMDKCTQCNYCAFVCPHAAIRPFLLNDDEADSAPSEFVYKKSKGVPELAAFKYRIQVAPLDCTGCQLCSIACPDDALTMTPLNEVRDQETIHWNFAINLPDRGEMVPGAARSTLKGSQFYKPLLEFSGACEGCGETPYVKLLTQLFGERLLIANATGCSSIWGASYPAVPYTVNAKGFGPAWGNSLFEDNAEYGYGMVISMTERRLHVKKLVEQVVRTAEIAALCPPELIKLLEEWSSNWKDENICQRVYELSQPMLLEVKDKHPALGDLCANADQLPKISIWMVGGDGWAFDIDFGGLDHVLAQGVNIKVLILDTEVYSNTGGQVSKATVAGAVHKFASGGRTRNKKDIGMLMMEYGDIYVASCASSANMAQTVRAFVEADRYDGPAMILAYSPCIEHQYIKPFHLQILHSKLAVDSGYWPLYRYNPALAEVDEPPLQMDSKKLKANIEDMIDRENRFASLKRMNPELAAKALTQLRRWAVDRFNKLKFRAEFGDDGHLTLANQIGKDESAVDVLYGSETGNAEELAGRIGKALRTRGLGCKVRSMEEVDADDLKEMNTVVIVCSTAGQGEFPSNAHDLWASLCKAHPDEKPFKSVTVATFGLGDSSYVFYNTAAKKFHAKFLELGAQEALSIGLGDDMDDEKYDSAFGDWWPEYLLAIKAPEEQNVTEDPDPPVYKVEEVPAVEYSPVLHLGTTHVQLVKNERITPHDYDVEVRHLEFDLSGTSMQYSLGDSLAVWPRNSVESVDRFCAYFGFNPNVTVKVSPAGGDSSVKHLSLFKQPITVRQLFEECLDIEGKPNRGFYEALWKHCKDAVEKSDAKSLLTTPEGKKRIKDYLEETMTFCDVLRIFKSVKPSLAEMIDLIPLMKCRYYSIASSQKYVGEKSLHLCVGIVDWHNPQGQLRTGGATGFIRRLAARKDESHVVCGQIKATAFNLPPSDTMPMLVAGMGTGIAPFRAFIQHRAWCKQNGRDVGPLVVYFGCRYQAKDWLYGDEMQAMVKAGVITELRCAFSRDQEEKHYVQHEISKDPDLFYKRFVDQEGYFYICGSAKQVPIDIRKAACSVIATREGVSHEVAEAKITELIIKGRYNIEAW